MTEPDPRTEPFVVVRRVYDPVQAEMLCGVLGDAGLNARLIGTRSAASIGAGQSIADLKVEVPRSHAARARELLDGIVAVDGGALLRDEGLLSHEREVDAELATARRRHPLVVVVAAAILLAALAGLLVRLL